VVLRIKVFQFYKKKQGAKIEFHSEIPEKIIFSVLRNFLCISKLHKISLKLIKYNILFRCFSFINCDFVLGYKKLVYFYISKNYTLLWWL